MPLHLLLVLYCFKEYIFPKSVPDWFAETYVKAFALITYARVVVPLVERAQTYLPKTNYSINVKEFQLYLINIMINYYLLAPVTN
jgi:hypothetical protein